MSPDDMKYPETNDDEIELVPAVFARDAEEAQRYCELLADHGIVGIVADDDVDVDGGSDNDENEDVEDDEESEDVGEGLRMTRGVAVLVEDTMLDEAGMVISDREDLGEFKFGEDDEEEEEEEDQREFAQGIDSEFEDDTGGLDLGLLGADKGDITDAPGDDDDDDDDDLGFDDELGDLFGDDFDVG